MSATSVRRLKDRGGAGGKIAGPRISKPLTPTSLSKPVTGKENVTFFSRASAQKPTIRPVPRVHGDAAPRCSSAPRPRNPSPLGRAELAVKKDRVLSRVSVDGSGAEKESGLRNVVGGVKSSEGNVNESRSLGKSGTCGESGSGIGDLSGLGSKSTVQLSRVGIRCENVRKSSEKSIADLQREVQDVVFQEKKLQERRDSFSRLDGVNQKNGNAADKMSINAGVLEKQKEKCSGPDSVNSQAGNKHQSRLHEKLAFLEGKVKRIASDIKRTKEMLDMNNPDASKVILSDIQEKISGIEKAMSHAMGDSDGKTSNSKDAKVSNSKDSKNDVRASNELVEKIQNGGASNLKGSVKDLNGEELEARLFPHHKLLRNRTSLKASSASAKPTANTATSDGATMQEEKVIPELEVKQLSSIDENPIALEFLATLDGEKQLDMEICEAQEMDCGNVSSATEDKVFDGKKEPELVLTTDETLDEFDNQENRKSLILEDANEETCVNQLNEIGCKTATGGWFVSEGEAVLLVHDDGSCSYYDVANSEEKAEFNSPVGVSPNIWRDCWIIRAPGADGCSGRYVVAASAGNSIDSGFCSWEFYSKDVRAFHIESGGPPASRTVLGPLSNNPLYRRNVLSNFLVPETRQWWYKPCGPLIISTATSQKGVLVYDIRDGEQIMKWEVQRPVLTMDYSSPLQWRSRGKVVIAEAEGISLWDVSALHPQALQSVSSSGRKISALHVNNTDAEIGGGVRQRISSSEAEGNDGVFCTSDSIEVLDFRHPSGIGLKIQKRGFSVDSVFSRGDSIFVGCTNSRKQGTPQLQQFSLRKQSMLGTYSLPEADVHSNHSAITQVWGNSKLTMGVCGLGLFVFDTVKEDGLHLFSGDYGTTNPKVREVIGPDDLYYPSFDYASSRALLVSRDRPASWRYLS